MIYSTSGAFYPRLHYEKGIHPFVFFLSVLFFITTLYAPAQEARPDWIRRKPQNTADTIYVVGMSEAMNSEAAALEAAKKSAGVEVARFFSESIESRLNEKIDYTNNAGAVSDNYRLETSVNAYANTIVSQVEPTEHWTEKNRANKWTAWVLAQTDRQSILDDIKTYPDTISARYHGLITPQDSVDNSLRLYMHILGELNKNPLDRALAYYEGSEGRVSLFNYCSVQIQNIASGIHFAPPPHIKIQKGEPLNTVINLSSDTLQSIGPIRCRVRIIDGNNIMQETIWTVGQDNSFSIRLQTEKLAVGNYNIALELLLNEIAPSLRQNPSSGFSFEVTPLNTISIKLFDNEAGNIAPKLSDIMQKEGLLLVESSAAYIATVQVTLNERQTGNYFYVEPTITINIALERDGTPLLTYTKTYEEFRHTTRKEALQRAYRNIENDLDKNFTTLIRSITK
jgi:hypothetical protein